MFSVVFVDLVFCVVYFDCCFLIFLFPLFKGFLFEVFFVSTGLSVCSFEILKFLEG